MVQGGGPRGGSPLYLRIYRNWHPQGNPPRTRKAGGVVATALSLDNIISSVFWALPKWTPELRRNASRDLLRHLVCRLYGASKGNLFAARVQASQASLAAGTGVSREWTNKLLARLVRAGWLESYAPRLPDGHYLPCIFKVGGQLKRLLCILLRRRGVRHSRVNDSSKSLPIRIDMKKSYTFWRELKEKLGAKMGKG